MGWKKIKDLAVVVSSYTDAQGAAKNRYQNVGSILRSDDGNTMIMLARWFNPAGVPVKDGSDRIIVSMFDPKDDAAPATHAPAPRAAAPAPTRQPGEDLDEDIPF
jgi:hypothetical protein